MLEKTYNHINDIKIFDYQTMTRLKHFACPECINRTKCRHHYEKRQSCDVCRDILQADNLYLRAHVDAFIDSQFFILKNIGSLKTVNDIFNKYRRKQCQK